MSEALNILRDVEAQLRADAEGSRPFGSRRVAVKAIDAYADAIARAAALLSGERAHPSEGARTCEKCNARGYACVCTIPADARPEVAFRCKVCGDVTPLPHRCPAFGYPVGASSPAVAPPVEAARTEPSGADRAVYVEFRHDESGHTAVTFRRGYSGEPRSLGFAGRLSDREEHLVNMVLRAALAGSAARGTE